MVQVYRYLSDNNNNSNNKMQNVQGSNNCLDLNAKPMIDKSFTRKQRLPTNNILFKRIFNMN